MAGTSDRAVAPSLDAGDLNPRPKDPHDRSVSCSCQPASNPSNLGVPPVPLDRSGEASNVGRPASTLLSQLYTHRGIMGVQSPSGAREGDPMFGRGHPTSTAYAMALVAGGPQLVGIGARRVHERSRHWRHLNPARAAGPTCAYPGHGRSGDSPSASGVRSRTATRKPGATRMDAMNVRGGLRAWRAVGGPITAGSK